MFDSLVDKQLFWVLCPSVFARAAAGGAAVVLVAVVVGRMCRHCLSVNLSVVGI